MTQIILLLVAYALAIYTYRKEKMYIAIQMYILIYLNVSIWLKEETFSSLKESMNKL